MTARGRTQRVLVQRHDGADVQRVPDELIVEEPMEIRVDGALVATTMRTPGNDFELAVGFLHTEGLLAGAPVRKVRYCATGSATDTEFNVVSVDTGGVAPPPVPRLTTTTSACGLCGSQALDDLLLRLEQLKGDPVPVEVLRAIPAWVQREQALFGTTGGVHAAAAFTPAGKPRVVREDIGRHNAVDKVVGRLALDGLLPAGENGLPGLFVSGRASFEMVQKAWAAGFTTVVAVSAPSALAVDVARAAGITLAGFVRGDRVNIYAP